jgi:glucans biosynthesis protein C
MDDRTSLTGNRLLFFDTVRTIAMLSVVLYHAVAAYSTLTPHWSVHDGTSVIADGIRELFDVYMMPVFFFLAGYFAVPSLRRHGGWTFIKGKLRRLGVPWLIAILIIIPLARYGMATKSGGNLTHQAFLRYWIEYLGNVGTVRVGLWTADSMNQMHFWFLSLLLSFLIIFGLVYALTPPRGRQSASVQAQRVASARGIMVSLQVAAVVCSACYFVISLVTPDLSWVMVDLLWQFQPGGFVLCAASLLAGALAFSKRWFEGESFPGSPAAWVLAGLVLTCCFFFIGRGVFGHPTDSNLLSPALLLGFAVVRSFLCFTILAMLVVLARRYGGRPNRLNRGLSVNSYNIYLVHIFFITFFQDVLMIWPGGPPIVKALFIFLAVLPISYGISKVIDRFPKAVVTFFVALFAVAVIWAR